MFHSVSPLFNMSLIVSSAFSKGTQNRIHCLPHQTIYWHPNQFHPNLQISVCNVANNGLALRSHAVLPLLPAICLTGSFSVLPGEYLDATSSNGLAGTFPILSGKSDYRETSGPREI